MGEYLPTVTAQQTVQYGIWFFPLRRFWGKKFDERGVAALHDEMNGERELIHMWGLGIQSPKGHHQ